MVEVVVLVQIMELVVLVVEDQVPMKVQAMPQLLEPQTRVEEAELAERVGLGVYAVGEHHREEYVVSAPAVVLAAIAALK